MGDDVSSVTIGSADGTVGEGEATVWMSAQEVLTAQTPGTLPVSGTGVLPSTDVTLHINGVAAGTVTVGIDGTWNRQLVLPAGTDGITRIMVGYTDANGDERVITVDIDVIAGGADATGPRRPASGTVLTPGAGNAQAIAADGTLLDATYAIGTTGVAVTVGDTTVGVEPDAVRGTVTTDGRLIVVLPAQVRVTAQGMLPGATATVWVMSDPQLLGTARVAANGTIDAVFDLPNALAAGEHTVQIDSATSTGERISVAVGMEVTQGSLPATGVHADLVLAWAVLIVALGALVALSGSGRRRPHMM